MNQQVIVYFCMRRELKSVMVGCSLCTLGCYVSGEESGICLYDANTRCFHTLGIGMFHMTQHCLTTDFAM